MTPSGDDQGAGKDNPVQKIPDFLSSLLLSHHVLKSISVFGGNGALDKCEANDKMEFIREDWP